MGANHLGLCRQLHRACDLHLRARLERPQLQVRACRMVCCCQTLWCVALGPAGPHIVPTFEWKLAADGTSATARSFTARLGQHFA